MDSLMELQHWDLTALSGVLTSQLLTLFAIVVLALIYLSERGHGMFLSQVKD